MWHVVGHFVHNWTTTATNVSNENGTILSHVITMSSLIMVRQEVYYESINGSWLHIN